MDRLLGLLRVRILRGVDLAYRDTRGSDPYVVLKMDGQRVKTSVKRKNLNPEWNEDLTLSISDPKQQVKLVVYDKDLFSRDDRMGEAEFEIEQFIDAANNMDCQGMEDGTVIKSLLPTRQNCLADESRIMWRDGKVVQDLILRLKNVETGEVELQLYWVTIPRM